MIENSFVESDRNRALIRNSFDKLINKHANDADEINSIINTLNANFDINSDFMKLYDDSPLHYSKKATILGTILFNHRMFSDGDQPDITNAYLKRCHDYINELVDGDLFNVVGFGFDNISNSILNRFNCGSSVSSLLDNFVTRPYHSYINGENPYPDFNISEDLSLSFLEPFYNSRFLQDNSFIELISSKTSKGKYDFYFDSYLDELVIRNTLLFSSNLLYADVSSKKRQDKIPAAISNLFGISKNSVPDLTAMQDLSYLAYSGLIDFDNIPDSNLKSKLMFISSDEFKLFEDVSDIVENDMFNFYLSEDKFNLFKEVQSKFMTSFYLNTRRLLNREGTMLSFDKFKSFYDAVDEDKLSAEIMETFSDCSVSFRNKLWYSLNSVGYDFDGIGKRDLANSLFYCHMSDKKGISKNSMPYSGKYTLGLKELTKSDVSRKSSNLKSFTKKQYAKNVSLPILDYINGFNFAYVLNPLTYGGDLPEDGPVYIPKGLMFIKGLPEDVIPLDVGISYGRDPCEEIIDVLRSQKINFTYLK